MPEQWYSVEFSNKADAAEFMARLLPSELAGQRIEIRTDPPGQRAPFRIYLDEGAMSCLPAQGFALAGATRLPDGPPPEAAIFLRL